MAVSSEAFILHNSRALAVTLIKGTAWRSGARRRKGRARCPDRTRSGGGRVLVAGAADDDPNGIAIYAGSVSSFVGTMFWPYPSGRHPDHKCDHWLANARTTACSLRPDCTALRRTRRRGPGPHARSLAPRRRRAGPRLCDGFPLAYLTEVFGLRGSLELPASSALTFMASLAQRRLGRGARCQPDRSPRHPVLNGGHLRHRRVADHDRSYTLHLQSQPRADALSPSIAPDTGIDGLRRDDFGRGPFGVTFLQPLVAAFDAALGCKRT
jgi:hypothetical protein